MFTVHYLLVNTSVMTKGTNQAEHHGRISGKSDISSGRAPRQVLQGESRSPEEGTVVIGDDSSMHASVPETFPWDKTWGWQCHHQKSIGGVRFCHGQLGKYSLLPLLIIDAI